MKNKLSVVLLVLETVCAVLEANTFDALTIKPTVLTTQATSDPIFKSDATASSKPQRNLGNEYKSISLSSRNEVKDLRKTEKNTEEKKIFLKLKDGYNNDSQFQRNDLNTIEKLVSKLNNNKFKSPSENMQVRTVRQINDELNNLKEIPENFSSRNNDHSGNIKSLKLSSKTDAAESRQNEPNHSEYVNFEVVDSDMSKDDNNVKTDGKKGKAITNVNFEQNENIKSYTNSDNRQIDLEQSAISFEAPNKDKDTKIGKLNNDNHGHSLIEDFSPSNKLKPNKNHIKSILKDSPHFRNIDKSPPETKFKIKRTTANRQPISKTTSTKNPMEYTDNWNRFESKSKNASSRSYNEYSTIDNNVLKRAARFKKRKTTQKSDKNGNEYVDSLEEENEKYLSKNVNVKNSHYSIETFDRPPTKKKALKHENQMKHDQPTSRNQRIYQKAGSRHVSDEIDNRNNTNQFSDTDNTMNNNEQQNKFAGRYFVTEDDFKTPKNYEYWKTDPTGIFIERGTKTTQQIERKKKSKLNKILDGLSQKLMKRIKPKLKTESIEHKWRKLTYSSSYSDEEDVLIKNIYKALKT